MRRLKPGELREAGRLAHEDPGKLRTHYVLATHGRLAGKVASECTLAQLKWARSYNGRTVRWIEAGDQRWVASQGDSGQERRQGKLPREFFRSPSGQSMALAMARVAWKATDLEIRARQRRTREERLAPRAPRPAPARLQPSLSPAAAKELRTLTERVTASQRVIEETMNQIRALVGQ